MAYYFRAFCTSPTVPTLAEVLEWVKARGVTVSVDPEDMAIDINSSDWGEVPIRLYYAEDKAPFVVEINNNEDAQSLAAQEIAEFLEQLAAVKKSRKRDSVIEQLQKTKFIVVCQIPTADINDAGFHALDVFLAYFLVHSGGMVQADGQGFYEMGKLIVELE